MTVTIDPSDMRPPTQRPPKRTRLGVRQFLLAGVGACALAAFTAGAFSFFAGLADPRAKTARPLPVASAWPDLKDGVPALTSRTADGADKAATATILNLPRPDEAGPQRGLASGSEFQLRNAPPAAPVAAAAARQSEAVTTAQPLPPSGPAAGSDPARSAAKPASVASDRVPPPIENAEIVTDGIKSAAVIAPTRQAPAIAPSRSESVRAKSAEPSSFVSLPPEPASVEPAQPEPAPTATPARADQPKPAPAVKAAAAKPAPVKPKPVQAAVAAKPPAPKPVLQASATPGPAQAMPAREADDPEVMGVKIPGGRQVRDGWKAVFGGGTQAN